MWHHVLSMIVLSRRTTCTIMPGYIYDHTGLHVRSCRTTCTIIPGYIEDHNIFRFRLHVGRWNLSKHFFVQRWTERLQSLWQTANQSLNRRRAHEPGSSSLNQQELKHRKSNDNEKVVKASSFEIKKWCTTKICLKKNDKKRCFIKFKIQTRLNELWLKEF